MVSTNIQNLGLTDELLKHMKLEQGEVTVATLSGKSVDSPIHGGIILTWMFELDGNHLTSVRFGRKISSSNWSFGFSFWCCHVVWSSEHCKFLARQI
mmetsp:Transcript_30361/g.98492  ORF Transcript_30361/g.98492 Transcript_30361/m.98492 type:complete len:97 (+) Transcript_30361:58-348(+)